MEKVEHIPNSAFVLVKDSYLLVEKIPFVVELLQKAADGCLNPRIPTRMWTDVCKQE